MNLPSELIDRLNLLEQLYEATSQGLWLIDEAGSTTAVNPAMCRMLGRDAPSMMGRPVFDLLQSDDALLLRQSLGQPASAQRDTEATLERPDGSRCMCVRRLSPLRDTAGDSKGWIMTWTDVTALRHAETTLQMFGLAADAAPDMISVVDETGRYRMVNDAWCRANRLARKDVIGRHVRQVAPDKPIPERRKELVACLLERNPLSARDRLELADRGMCDLEIDYYPFGDDIGQVRHVMMVCRDVSARQAVLRAVQEAEADKRALLDAFPGYIAAIDQNLRYVYVNAATAARLGGTPEQVTGRSIDEVLEGEVLDYMRKNVADRFREPGKPYINERTYGPGNGLPGVTLQVTQVASPAGADGRQTFYAFGLDISDHLRARRDVDLLLGRSVDPAQAT